MSITRLTRPLVESIAKTVKPYGDIIELDFQRNNISLLENLQPLSTTELAILNFSYNSLQTLQNLVPISSLREFRASANSLVSIDKAIPFPRLQLLDLSENKIYRVIADLPESLLELDLRSNLICTFESIAPVFKLSNLVSLDLRNNPIIDMYISSEAFKTYVTRFLPKLEMLNGEDLPPTRSMTASQMQLSKPERPADGVYDLTESRVAGVASTLVQSQIRPLTPGTERRTNNCFPQFGNLSNLGNNGPSDQGVSVGSPSTRLVQGSESGVNVKIYSNYYDRSTAKSQTERVNDSQRLVNEHLILFKTPSVKRSDADRHDLLDSSVSTKHVRSASQVQAVRSHYEPMDQDQDRPTLYGGGTAVKGGSKQPIHVILATDTLLANQQGRKPVVMQRSKSFRPNTGGFLQEVQISEPIVSGRSAPQQDKDSHTSILDEKPVMKSAERLAQVTHSAHDVARSLMEEKRSKPRPVDSDSTDYVTKLKSKCMEQEIEIQRLTLELKAATELLEGNSNIRGLLSREPNVSLANKMKDAGKLFAPTISGPIEYTKLLSQFELSELAMLKSQVQALEESVCTLENDFVVSYPHPEADKSKLHGSLYAYRRLTFSTLMTKQRQEVQAERLQKRLRDEIVSLRKQLQEHTEKVSEMETQKRLQDVQLKDAELRKGVKQQTIETLFAEMQQYKDMFDHLLELYHGGKNGLIPYLQQNSPQQLVDVIEKTLGMMSAKLTSANQSVETATSMLSRQKLRIEALVDELDNYEHKYFALYSTHEDLASKYDALKETYKALQLEKIKLESDYLDNDTHSKRPTVSCAVQVRPRTEHLACETQQTSARYTANLLSESGLEMQRDMDMSSSSPAVRYQGQIPKKGNLSTSASTTPTRQPVYNLRSSSASAVEPVSHIDRQASQNSPRLMHSSSGTALREQSLLHTDDASANSYAVSDRPSADIIDTRMAERKRLAADLKGLQDQNMPRSSSSNRKRAEKIMGMLQRLDSLM